MKEIIPIAASLTTAAKNVYDISADMISTRKQNKLISSAQVRRLKIAIDEAIIRERETTRSKGFHTLRTQKAGMLMQSYAQIEKYVNTPIGPLLLENIQDEARDLSGCIDAYDRSTRSGGV